MTMESSETEGVVTSDDAGASAVGAVGLSIREAYNGPVRHGLPFPFE